MALSLSRKAKSLLSQFQPFLALESFKWVRIEEGGRAQFSSDKSTSSCAGEVAKCRKLDSRNLGISRLKISVPSRIVLKKLQSAGFEAYLVGGCVRDLLLNKLPKDYDVVTTAELKQVKKKFRNAIIVGRKFPVCRVTENGSVVEVSSFETVAKGSRRFKIGISKKPKDWNASDFIRWKNSMERDFTVNSLLFDPFENVIFDYTNAMMDLNSLKLRTVKPANLSFKEDQARILRGLRLAARLNLSFCKETEDALSRLYSSVLDLTKSRLNLEMNYMLSYGAAEPSLLLLERFKLLDILLPFQVDNGFGLHSLMLTELFFHMDQLITCDQPCADSLWIAILAFHHAIFTNPQNAIVVLTFGLLLCHKTWEESIKLAREKALSRRIYVPEIIEAPDHLSDKEVIERVSTFSKQMANSVDILVNKNCLLESMSRFPEFPCSGLVFVFPKAGQRVKHICNSTTDGVNSVKAKERSGEINHVLLTKGDLDETRFVLGKIILSTLVEKKELAEREATSEKDDAQATNPPQNLKILDQGPKSVLPSKPHTTANKMSVLYEKLPDAAAKTSFVDNSIARSSGGTEYESTDPCSTDMKLKDSDAKARPRDYRRVLAGLFK